MARRHAAILAADVVGNSRHIRADEEGTITALKAHHDITSVLQMREKTRCPNPAFT